MRIDILGTLKSAIEGIIKGAAVGIILVSALILAVAILYFVLLV